MAKRNRFYLKRYYSDFPLGWGLYTDKEYEEKVYWMPFLLASDRYREEFESGKEEAIFTFARKCPECFREVWVFSDGTTAPCYSNNNVFLREHGRSWVLEQIEKWKAEDTPEARKKLKKLFSAYADSRGAKEKPPEEDWKIYEQIKKRINKKKRVVSQGDITKAIWKVVDSNNKIEHELDIELQRRLLELRTIEKGPLRNKLIPIAKETGIPQRKLRAYIKSSKTIFTTYKEIYYKLSKLEKKYSEDTKVTESNLRLEYFLCLKGKGMTIPKKYEDQFQEEFSLYFDVEWLRKGFISFPSLREGLLVYTGVRSFEEERLPLKEALKKVSKEKKVSLDKLTKIYINLKHIEAMYFHSDCLDVLKEL